MNEQGSLWSSTLVYPNPSSPATIRTRTVINVIYISGIVFMIVVFLLLLWVNLCSRRCWCWHDTPLIHRFDRQWLMKHSLHRKKHFKSNEEEEQQQQQQQRQERVDEEFPL